MPTVPAARVWLDWYAASVGLTYVKGTVRNDGQQATLDFLVDSGATYSLLPHDTWRRLGLEPERRQAFVLADGRMLERGLAECHFEFEGRSTSTWVILGEPDDEALLGAYTLEGLQLTLDPFSRKLLPMLGRLA